MPASRTNSESPPAPEAAYRLHPQTVGWFGTTAVAMGIIQSLFLLSALLLPNPQTHDHSWNSVADLQSRGMEESRALVSAPDHIGRRQLFILVALGAMLAVGIAFFSKALRQEKPRMFAAIVESSDDAILSCDLQSMVTTWNKGAETIFGYTAEEVIGSSIQRFAPADRQHEEDEIVAKIMEGERLPHFETRRQTKDGRVIEVSITVSPVRNSSGEVIGVSKVMRDITVRKLAEANLENVHRRLLDSSRQAGMAEVATNVLHNVGNVLNSVNVSAALVSAKLKGSALVHLDGMLAALNTHLASVAPLSNDAEGQALRDDLGELKDYLLTERSDLMTEVSSLRQNIEHINVIVAMQQSYAKVLGFTETVHISELVQDTLRMSAECLSKQDVSVVREFEEVPPVTVEKHKVLQILVNLVRNATHACDEVERTEKKMTFRISNGNGTVKVAVVDNGIGIPQENLTRIFNHGFTTKKNGHGFGLHSGALAARELGGALHVESKGLGHGATFTLELPVAPPASV